MNEREKIINAFKEIFGTPISETDREYLLAFAWFEKGWSAAQQSVHPTGLWVCENCAYDRQQSGANCVNCCTPRG